MKLFRLPGFRRGMAALALALAATLPLVPAIAAGDLSNSSVYSETDASNNTATDPGWPEGMAPMMPGNSGFGFGFGGFGFGGGSEDSPGDRGFGDRKRRP